MTAPAGGGQAAGRSRQPLATYRVQVTDDVPYGRVAELVPALADLGVSHLYLSPALAARPGTRHFYDVADHRRVDPVLGGEEGLRHLADVAHAAGLGLIGDVVPNHMGTGPWSPMWDRLLAEGRSGEAARWFDVDWAPALPGASDKVVLPVLAGPYGDELVAGAIGLATTAAGVRVTYGDLSFPLAAETVEAVERAGADRIPGRPGELRTWGRMHSLLEQQRYRLVSWRAGRRLVNYRRFSAVDAMAALRVEDPVVFEATHGLLISLVRDGVLDGLRIDHLDGLADPGAYLRQLRDAVGPDAWLVVEKLAEVGPGDGLLPLPAGWPVDGTTGYELLRVAFGLHVDPRGLAALRRLADAAGGLPDPRARWQAKALQLDAQLGPDLRRLVRVAWDAAQDELAVRDVDYRTLLEAIGRLLVALPVYRTHVDPATGEADDADRQAVAAAVAAARDHPARRRVPDVVWRWLGDLLTGQVRWSAAAAEAVTRFQQLSSPVAALGIEERLLLRHQVLLGACELAVDPDDPAVGLAAARAALDSMPPTGMRTTATHDTKHAEDVRLRTAALTGMASEWAAVADRVVAGTAPPDPALALRLLQVVVGTWPADDDGSAPLAEVLDRPAWRDRLAAHAVQVARGQDVVTAHIDPDAAAEADLLAWLHGVVDPAGAVAPELRPLALRAAEVGMAASLSQVLLRVACRGVPDTYQGTERWDDSLTDPDNRRPVDFDALAATAAAWRAAPPAAAELWAARRDGRVKQWVLRQALRARAAHPAVFGPAGGQGAVAVTGRWAGNVLALHRWADPDAGGGAGGDAADGDGGAEAVAVCPRLLGRVTDAGRFPPLGRIWADTDVVLPAAGPGSGGGDPSGGPGWTDVLTGHTVPAAGPVPLAVLLADLPVALLVRAPAS